MISAWLLSLFAVVCPLPEHMHISYFRTKGPGSRNYYTFLARWENAKEASAKPWQLEWTAPGYSGFGSTALDNYAVAILKLRPGVQVQVRIRPACSTQWRQTSIAIK